MHVKYNRNEWLTSKIVGDTDSEKVSASDSEAPNMMKKIA